MTADLLYSGTGIYVKRSNGDVTVKLRAGHPRRAELVDNYIID